MATQSKSSNISSSSSNTITKNMKIEVLLLMSTYNLNLQQRTHQNRARTILNGAMNANLSSSSSWSSSSPQEEEIAIKEIDAADPSNKELRTKLFQISGIRGNYPQIFIRRYHDDEKQAEKMKGSVFSATNTNTNTNTRHMIDYDYNNYDYKFVGGFAELEAYNDVSGSSLLKTILLYLLQEDGDDDEGAGNDSNKISRTVTAVLYGGDYDNGNQRGPLDDANKIAAVEMTNEQQQDEEETGSSLMNKKKKKDKKKRKQKKYDILSSASALIQTIAIRSRAAGLFVGTIEHEPGLTERSTYTTL